MKAIVYDRYGSFDDLEMRNIAKPVIEADEVLVRMARGRPPCGRLLREAGDARGKVVITI